VSRSSTTARTVGTRGRGRGGGGMIHASWLNEAELLVGAFGYHYLRRASWAGRGQFIKHVLAAAPEYNRLYAHPFEWT
jgi:hypothetical protein